ncbi:MAG: hypothetical protein ACRCTP_02465 [Aeromonas popoffii]|uniref:hypothetical protein n=1 Tax=Aeromonas popoffii TaxID=70856 RepID=UPI003F3657CB
MIKTFWNCADGRKVSISEMTDFHVFNAMTMLARRHDLPVEYIPDSIDEARICLVNYVKNKPRSRNNQRQFNQLFGDQY